MISQEIRYCTTADDVRIAWASSGQGPPLVKAANWLNHLEFDWESPIWRHVIRELSNDFRLIRYDARGNGLSDWEVEEISFEAFVSDLEAVVDAAGLERFSLLGISQGCPVSIAYAVRHPHRVEKLVLHGGFARGSDLRGEEEREQRRALLTLAKQGWGTDNPAFRQAFTAFYLPDATREQQEAWNELQRIATPVENALRIFRTTGGIDVADQLGSVSRPTLITHSRGELPISFDNARELASGIVDSRLVSLESRNHLIMETEAAWSRWLGEVLEFLGVDRRTVEPPAELSPGNRLLHYRIERHIATGGMGAVYRGRDLKLGRDVAIKVLPPELIAEPDRAARFEREARILAALNHPNIAAIYDLEEADATRFIVMELADGVTLQERLGFGPLDSGEALRICGEIGAALDAAHAARIIHRDLKPSNVMLTRRGVKVLDFGIAKPLPSPASSGSRPHGSGAAAIGGDLTASGTLLGTGPYMSPEQVRGDEIGPATDVWALGCLLYEMLSGRSPFLRDSLGETVAAVIEHEPDWNQLPPSTPRAVLDLLESTLAKDVGERLADMTAVLEALDDATTASHADGVRNRGVWQWLRRS